MSFVSEFNQLELAALRGVSERASAEDVEAALRKAESGAHLTVHDFAVLISPRAEGGNLKPETRNSETQVSGLIPHPSLERMARLAQQSTVKHFGRVMRFFAPLYLSNECVNVCKYCGFSRDNPILRVTLTPEQVASEARFLAAEGFRNILLVAGEHPRFIAPDYMAECVRRVRAEGVPSVSIEVAPLETEEYLPVVAAGAEGLVVYQETYNREVYREMHTSGPKKEFDWRLESVERGYRAGFKRLGIGALLGLWHWREDAIALAAHAEYLLRHCWKAQLTISLPRLRPAAGEFEPKYPMSDRELAQLVCALRLTFPKVGLVLSTREAPKVRDGLVQLGITMMSAGAHTEPGGYTGAGREKLHVTERGRQLTPSATLIQSEGEHATVQFRIADMRSPEQVAVRLKALGYEPVWKDWDEALAEKAAG